MTLGSKMATLLTIPAELRLHIYNALIIPAPRCIRISPATSGPVLCYTRYTYNAAIIGVNKLIRKEATPFLNDGNGCLLYIYLIFKGHKAGGADLGAGLSAALKTFSNSKLFHHVHTCIIDIRLFCEVTPNIAPKDGTFEELGNSVEAICDTVSQSLALRQVEVSWSDYFRDDLQEHKRKSLQPLGKLGVMLRARDRVVKKTRENSERDFLDWPNMLKPYRSLNFCQPSFNEDEKDNGGWNASWLPQPSDVEVFGGGID